MINFLDTISTTTNFCGDLGDVVILLAKVVKLLQWLIPIGLIIFGMLDLGKAVIAGKEDEMKKATSTLIKRVIYAIAIFLVVTIVYFAVGLVSSDKQWHNCWTGKYNDVTNNQDDASGVEGNR